MPASDCPKFDGIQVERTSALFNYCTRHDGAGTRVLVTDLSLGGWRSFQAAYELFAQLDLTWPEPVSRSRGASLGASEVIASTIDREMQGDRAAAISHDLALALLSEITDGVRTVVVVCCPRFGLSWDRTDVLFLRFLARDLAGTEHNVVLVSPSTSQPSMPADWEVSWRRPEDADPPGAPLPLGIHALLPGVLTRQLAGAISIPDAEIRALVALPGGAALVPIEVRRDPRDVSVELSEHFASATEGVPAFRAFISAHHRMAAVPIGVLWELAEQEAAGGSPARALSILDSALQSASNPVTVGVLTLMGDGLRIRIGRFDEVAGDGARGSSLPDRLLDLPEDLVALLLFTRGWALTMLGRVAEADACFARCQAGLTASGATYLPYLYNIWALAKLRTGQRVAALELEDSIEDRLEPHGTRSWQLRYISCLNRARIHRAAQENEQAGEFYDRAFDTLRGSASPGDLVHRNVCLARMREDEFDHAAAFRAWVAAALIWVSCPVPEAITHRVKTSIIGSSRFGPAAAAVVADPVAADLCDEVSRAFVRHISRSAENTQDDAVIALISLPLDTHAPTFVTPAALQGWTSQISWWSDDLAGWRVLCASSRLPAPGAPPAAHRLRALLSNLLDTPRPVGARTVLVDSRNDFSIAASLEDLVEVCLRVDVARLETPAGSINFDGATRERLAAALYVAIDPGVDEVIPIATGLRLTFKRYRRGIDLDREQSELVRCAGNAGVRVDRLRDNIGGSACDVLAQIRHLEALGVLRTAYPRGFTVPSQVWA